VQLVDHDKPVYCVKFSPDGRLLATGAADVLIWDCREFERPPIKVGEHEDSVLCLDFSFDQRWLATGDHGGGVFLWDLTLLKEWLANRTIVASMTPIPLSRHAGSTFVVTFSPDSRMLATASHDKTCNLWKRHEGIWKPKPDLQFRGHHDHPTFTVFSRNSKWLLTAGDDNAARIPDLTSSGSSRKSLTVLDNELGPVRSVGFLTQGDGYRAVTGCLDLGEPLRDIPTEKLVDLAEKLLQAAEEPRSNRY
jgi:WD40 repeat protein